MAQKEASKLILVDLEATCWEPPIVQSGEIIEIGMCLLDLFSAKIERKSSYIVRPRNLDISQFCTDLTGYHKEDIVKHGRPLREVLNTARKEYPLSSHVWGSWGFYDRNQIERECAQKDIFNPFGPDHLNLKTLHAMMNGLKKGIGMQQALTGYGMSFEGRPHKGVDDAVNLAHLALKMLRR